MIEPAYDERGLIPAVVQDAQTDQVLMVAWMNADALRLTQEAGQADTTDCLRNLITADNPVGQRLIKVANSPAFLARHPVRDVTEAIVRIGIRETRELVRRAITGAPDSHTSLRTLKALELLESLVLLFPDRTATKEGMLALLEELNRPTNTATRALDAAARGEQAGQGPLQARPPE